MATPTSMEWGSSWFVWEFAPHTIHHVIPEYDLGVHFEINCPCRPDEEGDIVVHNSFDGREDFQTKRRKKS